MRFGIHIRIDKGLIKAIDHARELGCQAAQLFSGNPNAWHRAPLDVATAADFTARAREYDIHPIILHTPYLLNLAAPDDDIFAKSKLLLRDAVCRAPYMGASLVVTHIGSHKGAGFEAGVARIAEAVRFALEPDPDVSGYGANKACQTDHGRNPETPGPTIALELGAGAGRSIGSRFDEIAQIIEALPDVESRVGICIDTAHLWGSGYDISTEEGVHSMFAELDRTIGFSRLRLIHLNDTQTLLGGHRDRHWHVGKGSIGLAGFRAIVNYPGTGDLPGIIETPMEPEGMDRENLGVLRGMAGSQGTRG